MLYRLVISLCVILLFAQTVAGKNFISHDIFIYENQVTLAPDISAVFDRDLLREFEAGYPLYLSFTVDLQKSVPLWFDQTINTHTASLMLVHQKFGDRFNLKLFGYDSTIYTVTLHDIDDIVDQINEKLILAVAPIDRLNSEDKLYLRFTLKLRHLSARDISRASDWYRGKNPEVSDSNSNGEDLPIYLFDQILNISGLGPRKIESHSRLFNLGTLRTVQPQN